MKSIDELGIDRSLEPKASLPQPAWKLDNRMVIGPTEILIDVKMININLVSFNEIMEEGQYQEEEIKRRILEIIKERGKLHNPVTGTGGMLWGTVLEMGKDYPNRYHISPGDEIISLASLSLTPIRIEKILSIDFERAQLEVEGKCILFANGPLIQKPQDLPVRLVVFALDEAGAPCRTYGTVKKGQDVMILGANGKIGLLCAYAAKDKLGSAGRLVGIVKSQESRKQVESYGVFDAVFQLNVANTAGFCLSPITKENLEKYHVVINCVNSPNTEMAALLFTKNKGTIFFATLSSDYKLTSLTAEGIGKEITIVPYTGFLEGHSNYTLGLLRRRTALREQLQHKSKRSVKQMMEEGRPSEEGLADFNLEEGCVFVSKAALAAMQRALKVSQFNSNVLIYGESGVGKEIVAKMIHQNSTRKSFPLIKINCASIPEHLLESELFGYERGSFTGANVKGKIGLWEAAQNGTLFLDEIGELPLSFQVKILRAIQEKEIIRVGAVLPVKVDVRIIAATNRNLAEMTRQGLFREDLYYRLNVYPLFVPPLRERREDIVPLVDVFTKKYNAEFHCSITFGRQSKVYLRNCMFPGNVRELQNLVQRIIITAEKPVVSVSDVIMAMSYDSVAHQDHGRVEVETGPEKEWVDCPSGSLKEILAEVEASVLLEYKKRYGSTRKIAEMLKISQPSVVRKLHYYGINGDAGNV